MKTFNKYSVPSDNRIHSEKRLKLKDPGSAITHFLGVVMIILAAPPLFIRAFSMPGHIHGISMVLFVAGVLLLYSASTIYHSLDISESVNLKLRKIDHMMIYMLIAGSYSPVCLIALKEHHGFVLFAVVWIIAFAGVFQALFLINCPKWVSSVIYLIMGWLCIFIVKDIYSVLPVPAFAWLLCGGLLYTVGALIYALKLPALDRIHKYFGSHEIFHLFCLGGTFCHYIFMYKYIAVM